MTYIYRANTSSERPYALRCRTRKKRVRRPKGTTECPSPRRQDAKRRVVSVVSAMCCVNAVDRVVSLGDWRGYTDKYEDDRLGEELGNDARVWRVLIDEGRDFDAAMLQRFRDHLDVDLVFVSIVPFPLEQNTERTLRLVSSRPSQQHSSSRAINFYLLTLATARTSSWNSFSSQWRTRPRSSPSLSLLRQTSLLHPRRLLSTSFGS